MWGFFALLLLALPRFFLIPIDDTGIRTEDILLFLLFPATVKLLLLQRHRMGSVIRSFSIYFGIVALASSVAGLTGTMPLPVSMAFGLRPALYACALVVGWHLGLYSRNRRHGLLHLCVWILGINLIWGIGVAAGLLPNLASFHPSRLSGLTNGPYELSAMICLISVALMWARRPFLLTTGIAGLLWTQARIALLAFILYIVASLLRRLSWVRILISVGAFILLGIVINMRDSNGVNFSESLTAILSLSESFSAAVSSRDDYFDLAYSSSANNAIVAGDGDPSMLLRVARWSVVMTTAGNSIGNLLLGMGPGFYSVALDGNYVRLIGETGLLGLLTLLWIGRRLWESVIQPEYRRLMLGLLLQLAVVAIFIDVFASLKTMCLFWMMVGAMQREDQEVQSCSK